MGVDEIVNEMRAKTMSDIENYESLIEELVNRLDLLDQVKSGNMTLSTSSIWR